MIPGKRIPRNVFTLQTRISRASRQPEIRAAQVRMIRATWLRSRMNGNGAPCHALSEWPPEVAGVQGKDSEANN